MSGMVAQEPLAMEPRDERKDPALVFERMASDPNVDVDKLERLIAMQERIVAKAAESEFNTSMSKAQHETGRVSADATNPQTRSRYASYAALDRALRPIYTEHGFALSFDTGDAPAPEFVRVLCYVSHTGGHSKTYRVDMPSDGKGAKGGEVMTKTHAVGAAASYGMRYLLKMIFNVAIGEDDLDGNAATQKPAPAAPKGFDDWLVDMELVAEEGTKKLEAAWQKSSPALRKHLIALGKWEPIKTKAAKVKA